MGSSCTIFETLSKNAQKCKTGKTHEVVTFRRYGYYVKLYVRISSYKFCIILKYSHFSAVYHLRLSVVSSRSISIGWQDSEHSNSLMYHINYTSPMSNNNQHTILSSSNDHTLIGLHPYEEYTISVQAGNRAGLSAPVTGTARMYSDGEFPYNLHSIVILSWCESH